MGEALAAAAAALTAAVVAVEAAGGLDGAAGQPTRTCQQPLSQHPVNMVVPVSDWFVDVLCGHLPGRYSR